jgi:hypothetical protein
MALDQQVYREWLRQQLDSRPRGTKAALARFLGFSTPNPISRMLNADGHKEERQISAVELARMAQFFGTSPPLLDAASLTDDEIREKINVLYRQLSPAGRRQWFVEALEQEVPDRPEGSARAERGPGRQ